MPVYATLSVKEIVQDVLEMMRLSTDFNSSYGSDAERAVFCLNKAMLAINSPSSALPFLTDFSFTIDTTSSKYVIGLTDDATLYENYYIKVNFLVYEYSSMRMPIRIVPDIQYYGTSHYNPDYNPTLPYKARVYNQVSSTGVTYTVIELFAVPNQTYTLHGRGIQKIDQVAYNSTITSLPDYYRDLLLFETIRNMIPYYGRADMWASEFKEKYMEIRANFASNADIDLAIRTGPELSSPFVNYYGNRLGVSGI